MTWTEDVNPSEYRLDIVALLGLIGEDATAAHAQMITASPLCLLPRLLPAPQTFLKSSRPVEVRAKSGTRVIGVAGKYNGRVLDTISFSASALHPLENSTPFGFRVLRITKNRNGEAKKSTTPSDDQQSPAVPSNTRTPTPIAPTRRQTLSQLMWRGAPSNTTHGIKFISPISALSVVGSVLSLCAALQTLYLHDGIGFLAISLLSLVSSISGYASWWKLSSSESSPAGKPRAGDVVIRTEEGAFLVIKCTEEVAKELYFGFETCEYRTSPRLYRLLMGLATITLMLATILLCNCDFQVQLFVGGSYILLKYVFLDIGVIGQSLC
jgi:hypothetical protein